MRLLPILTTACVAVAVLLPTTAAAVPVPPGARAVDTSHPDRWVGSGTARSCTSRAVVRAVAKGGIIRFRCGPAPVRIEMGQTAKVVNTSRRVVLDGRGRVTLSGGGKRRILYQNTCDRQQTWTTSHCDDQATPRLVVQNLTFADGDATGETVEGGGGGAIFARGGRLKIVGSTFTGNRCDPTGPDLGGGAVRALSQYHGRPVYVVAQHVHPRRLQQRRRAEQHRRLVVDLQQRLHRQPRDRPRRQPRALGHARRRLGRRALRGRQRLPRAARRHADDGATTRARAAARSSSSATTAAACWRSAPRPCGTTRATASRPTRASSSSAAIRRSWTRSCAERGPLRTS